MGTQVAIELLPVPECPRADAARALLAQCLDEACLDVAVIERVGEFPSPTILVNGRDVMTGGTVAGACNCLFGLLTGKDPAQEVRAFGLGDYLTARHTALDDQHMSELRKTTRKRFRIAVASTFGLAIALGAGITGLLALALSGRLQLAERATAAGALLLLGERIMTTVNSVGDMFESGLYVEDFTAFLANAPLDHGATGSKPAPDRFGRISVENLTFTYPAADAPALRDVSLTIEAGQVIALVGENGSGKTTLAKLLPRLYLPQHAAIVWLIGLSFACRTFATVEATSLGACQDCHGWP